MGHTGWPLQLFAQRVSALGHTGWPLQLFTQGMSALGHNGWPLQLFTQRVSALGHTGWPLQLFTQRVSALGHTGWPLQLFTQRVSALGETGWPLKLFTQRVSALGWMVSSSHTGGIGSHWMASAALHTSGECKGFTMEDLQASDCFRRSVPGGPGHVCQSVSLLAVLVILDSLAVTCSLRLLK